MGWRNETQCHCALSMVEGELSFREVARRMGSHQMIMKLVQGNTMTGSVSDRQCPVCQIVTSQQQDHHIFLMHLLDPFRTSVQTAKETVGVYTQCISASTVRRHCVSMTVGATSRIGV